MAFLIIFVHYLLIHYPCGLQPVAHPIKEPTPMHFFPQNAAGPYLESTVVPIHVLFIN